MEERIIRERATVLRHGSIELLEHWILAFSGFVLIFSGFGELPMYKRFMLTQVPGLAWTGDFFINLKIHYLSGIVFVSLIVFHLIYHGWLGHQGLLPRKGDVTASIKTLLAMFGFGEEPRSDKYLPEQRLAYAYLGGVGLILVLTGIVKVLKNLPGVSFSPGVITAATLIHTFATVLFLLGVLAHLAALVFKVNRPLARSIFTKEVDLDYIRERHTIWYHKLAGQEGKAQVGTPVENEVGEEERKEETAAGGLPGQTETEKKEEQMATVVRVKGMSCQHCVMSVKKALGQLDGVQNVNVDLPKGEVSFENTQGTTPSRIEQAITDAGYEVIQS